MNLAGPHLHHGEIPVGWEAAPGDGSKSGEPDAVVPEHGRMVRAWNVDDVGQWLSTLNGLLRLASLDGEDLVCDDLVSGTDQHELSIRFKVFARSFAGVDLEILLGLLVRARDTVMRTGFTPPKDGVRAVHDLLHPQISEVSQIYLAPVLLCVKC